MKTPMFVLCVTATLAISAATAQAADIYVDDTGTSCPGTGAGTVGDPYCTIQEGVDAATSGAGDIIHVAAGTYNESLTITKSDLIITGDPGAATCGTGGSAPILDGTGLGNVSAITFPPASAVSGVTIEGFEIRNYSNPSTAGDPNCGFAGGGVGSGIESWNSVASGCTFQDNYLHDLGWNGVLIGSDNNTVQTNWMVRRNQVNETMYAGIELTNTTSSSVLDNCVVARTSTCVNSPVDAGDSAVGIEIAVRAHAGQTVAAGSVTVARVNGSCSNVTPANDG